MKILLTGSKGQLGTDFQLVSAGRHEVFAYDLDLDVTDRWAVTRRIADVAPDLVVNAAAFTDVDGAESEELSAYRVNALGPQNLALGCQVADIPLLHVSTDFVFNGDSTSPYTEFDRPDPRGIYGKSKYAGERCVTGLLNRYYICRTSWLFGASGKNFVKTMLAAGRRRSNVQVVDDQEGSPTYSLDLASKLLEVIETGSYGIYHISNAGSCTWYELAREIFEIEGIDTPVLPISTRELGRPAPRPRYSVMRGLALTLRDIAPMRHYDEALEDFIKRDLPAAEERGGAS